MLDKPENIYWLQTLYLWYVHYMYDTEKVIIP